MPPLPKLTLFISFSPSLSLYSKPLISLLLLRRSAASLSPPASSPCRFRISLPITHSLPQSQLLSIHTRNYKQIRQLGGGGDGGGVFVARFSRQVGGGGGGGSGREMGSETNNNRDVNNHNHFLNHNLSISSALIKQNNHNHDNDNDDRCNQLAESPSKQPRHQSTKLLTLPTILTIGRVAAVPLLVCSKFRNSNVLFCFVNDQEC